MKYRLRPQFWAAVIGAILLPAVDAQDGAAKWGFAGPNKKIWGAAVTSSAATVGDLVEREIRKQYAKLDTYTEIKAFIAVQEKKKHRGRLGAKFVQALKAAKREVETCKSSSGKLKKLGEKLNEACFLRQKKALSVAANKRLALVVRDLSIGPLGITVNFVEEKAVMEVASVESKGPGAGILKPGDLIISANGRTLSKLPRIEDKWGDRFMVRSLTLQELADAIDHAEGVGKLTLGIERGGSSLDAAIPMERIGTFSPTFPFNCPKSFRIFTNACDFLLAGHRAKAWGTGDGMHKAVKGIETGMCGLALLSHPNRAKYMPALRKTVLELLKVENLVEGELLCTAYVHLFLSEYYLAETDEQVKARVKAKLEQSYRTYLRGAMPYGGWGHRCRGGIYGSGGYATSTSNVVMALGAMSKVIKLNPGRTRQTLNHLNAPYDRGQICYCGTWVPRGGDEWSPEALPVGGESVLRTGATALGLSLMGRDPYRILPSMTTYLSEPLTYTHYYLPHCGHAIGLLPCALAVARLNPKAFRAFMDAEKWFMTMGRRYDGELMLGPVFKKRLRHDFSKKYGSLKAAGCMAMIYGIGSGKLELHKGMEPTTAADDMSEYQAWNNWLWHRKGNPPPRISAGAPPLRPLPPQTIRPMTYQSGQENVFGARETVVIEGQIIDEDYKSVMPLRDTKTGIVHYIVFMRSDDDCSWYKDGKLIWSHAMGNATKEQRDQMHALVKKGARVKVTMRKSGYTKGWLRAHKLEF